MPCRIVQKKADLLELIMLALLHLFRRSTCVIRSEWQGNDLDFHFWDAHKCIPDTAYDYPAVAIRSEFIQMSRFSVEYSSKDSTRLIAERIVTTSEILRTNVYSVYCQYPPQPERPPPMRRYSKSSADGPAPSLKMNVLRIVPLRRCRHLFQARNVNEQDDIQRLRSITSTHRDGLLL